MQFRCQENFFGHLVSEDYIHIYPGKLNAIVNMKAPENVKDLQTLLGMINFLTKFIPRAQEIMKPINELLQKDVVFT